MSSRNDAARILVERRLNKFLKKDVPAARATATNKALAMAKTRVVRVISADVQIKSKVIRQRVVDKKAFKEKAAQLVVYRRNVPVIALGARQTKAGVRAGKHFIAGAFIADGRKGTGGGGSTGRRLNRDMVLKRDGRARYPISVQSVSIRESVNNKTPDQVKKVMAENFNRLYQHELRRRAAR